MGYIGVSGYYCTAWKCLLLFGFSSQVRRMGIAMILDWSGRYGRFVKHSVDAYQSSDI